MLSIFGVDMYSSIVHTSLFLQGAGGQLISPPSSEIWWRQHHAGGYVSLGMDGDKHKKSFDENPLK